MWETNDMHIATFFNVCSGICAINYSLRGVLIICLVWISAFLVFTKYLSVSKIIFLKFGTNLKVAFVVFRGARYSP